MMTTTTTQTAPQAPAFQAPLTDNYREQGRAALLFLLAQGDTATWRLDDGQLVAAADYASIAVTAREMSVPAIERIAALQAWCRRLVAARAASAAALAALQGAEDGEAAQGAAPAPIVDQAGSQAAQGAALDAPAADDAPVDPLPAAAGPVPAGFRAMASRFPGRCSQCGLSFPVGMPIHFRKGDTRHADTAICEAHRGTGGQGGNGGGGGSKVPRRPRPVGPTSPAGLALPVAAPVAVTGPAAIPARFTAISPAQPALRPVPAISLAAEDLF